MPRKHDGRAVPAGPLTGCRVVVRQGATVAPWARARPPAVVLRLRESSIFCFCFFFSYDYFYTHFRGGHPRPRPVCLRLRHALSAGWAGGREVGGAGHRRGRAPTCPAHPAGRAPLAVAGSHTGVGNGGDSRPRLPSFFDRGRPSLAAAGGVVGGRPPQCQASGPTGRQYVFMSAASVGAQRVVPLLSHAAFFSGRRQRQRRDGGDTARCWCECCMC